MAERAGAEVDAGDPLHVRVVAEGAAEARVVVERGGREEAEIGEHRVEADGGVALAQHEAVAVRPFRIGGVDPEMRVEERGEQLGGGEGAGIVAGAGDPAEPHGLEPDELGAIGEVLLGDVAATRYGHGQAIVPRCAAEAEHISDISYI